MSNFVFYGQGMEADETNDIKVALDGDYIELQDDGCIYALIPIEKWQKLRSDIDERLAKGLR
jgi:hypothetical protein